MSRVQVRDLDPPERLQPSGIQRDTFAQAAPPPIDQNLERLASSLGAFADSVNSFHRASVIAERRDKAKRDKERLDSMDAEWNRWLAVTPSADVLNAIRAGKAPYQSDPLFAAVIDHYWGKREAEEVSKKVYKALETDTSISLQPGFDPERYVLEHTAKHLEDGRLSRSKAAQKSFQGAIASLKEGVIGWHEKNQGKRAQEAAEYAAFKRFQEKLNAAAEGGYDVKSTQAYLQSIYQEFGPRVRGGSLDFQYQELDNIKLRVLEDMARNGNEKQAHLAAALVQSERPDLLNPGKSLPSLASTPRTKDRAENIARTAFQRIDQFAEARETEKFIQQAVTSIARMDGQTALYGDKIRVQLDTPSRKVVELKAEDIRKEAFRRVIQQQMQEKGRPLTVAEEFELAAKNGMEAPTAGPLNQEAAAALAPLSKDPTQKAQQISRFIAAANMYDTAANAAGGVDISGQIKKDNRDVYETYLTLTKRMGWTAEQAAEAVMRTYSETSKDEMTKRDLISQETIRSKVAKLDFNGYFRGGRADSSWGQKLLNGGEIQREVYHTALAIARVKGVTEKDAIDQAADIVLKRATFVNGVAIYGYNGYNPSDTPYIEHILKDRFKNFPKSMAAAGVTDPSQLTLLMGRSGAATVVNQAGDPVQILPEENRKAGATDAAGPFGYDSQPGERPTAMNYSPAEHQALRARHAELMRDYEFKRSTERHEIIRKSIGQPVPELNGLINPPVPAPKTRTKMDGTPFDESEKPVDRAVKDWIESTPSARELGKRIREDFQRKE